MGESLRGDVWTALLLTCMGAAGTALGGLMVVIQPSMDFKRLGILQGVAGGLMLCLSFVDLLPAAMSEIGFAAANMYFFAGVALFAAIVAYIPESSITDSHMPHTPRVKTNSRGSSSTADAKSQPPPVATATATPAAAKGNDGKRRQVLLSGLITALGIALHNFPEGVAVFLASMKSSSIGASLACAIALHNIPEGVAVALPVYFATNSRLYGLWMATVSGLAEPLAVVVLGLLLPWWQLSHAMVEAMLAGVAGIMAFLTLHELIPLSLEHAGRSASIAAVFFGMAVMAANLFLLDHWLGAPH